MTKNVVDRGKTSKRQWTKASWKHKYKYIEFSSDKSRGKGSPSFAETARPYIWVKEYFRIKGR